MGGDDIWLYMSAPGGWARVVELFADIGGTYRPIPFSLFSVYHLFGSNIPAMHWLPIVLHTINVILVYLLVRKISGSRIGAATASIIYGVSHIVFFDVFNLTGLVDQIFLLFGLTSILLVWRGKIGWAWLLFILTMFSKESFVTVLLVISYRLWQKKASWKQYLIFWAPTIVYFGLKLALYRQQGSAYSYVINFPTLRQNLFDYGLWLINWRHGWQMGMPYPPHALYDWVSVGYLVLLIIGIGKAWQEKREIFWLGLGWGLSGLLPFYFLGRALPFYLELSLIGLALTVSGGIAVMKGKWLYSLVLVGIAIYMSLTTKAQWVENSFSARGVLAAEQYKREVIDKYDWSLYDKLCLTGMGEYELWATGVGELVNLLPHREIDIVINPLIENVKCHTKESLEIEYRDGKYIELGV